MSWDEMSVHVGDIYRLAISNELRGYGFWLDGSEWQYPEMPMADVGSPYGPRPSDTVTQVHLRWGDVLNDFSDFTQMPDPEAFDPAITQMEKVVERLSVTATIDPTTEESIPPNGMDGHINSLSDVRLASWKGDAADEFRLYLAHLGDKTGHQWALAWVLLNALRAEQGIWQRAQVDVDQVAHKALSRLSGEGSGEGGGSAGKVLNALTTLAGFALPGLGSTVKVFTATGAVAQLASLLPKEEGLPGDPSHIISDMRDDLRKVKEAVEQKESELHDELTSVAGAVSRKAMEYYLERPSLSKPGNIRDKRGTFS
ncbi:hypothetical protein [Nocardioides jensenii]|uniref:hypothetical protein n=1 Tax=Nocardioides jensenii TaxID=1843 RepID=UPI00082EB7BB|nr:hypothetical protein [Nocardioides jensenii]